MKMKDFEPAHFNWHVDGEVTVITHSNGCCGGLSAIPFYQAAGVRFGGPVVT